MVIGSAESINGITVRLTDERWEHILDVRPYMLNYKQDVLDAVNRRQVIWRASDK